MDYKKFYRENLNIPKYDTRKWHIHHIDMNRNNNDIKNLVCIPKILHIKLHCYFSKISLLSDKNILNMGYIIMPYDLENIQNYIEYNSQIYGFIQARNYVLFSNMDSSSYFHIISDISKNLGYEV